MGSRRVLFVSEVDLCLFLVFGAFFWVCTLWRHVYLGQVWLRKRSSVLHSRWVRTHDLPTRFCVGSPPTERKTSVKVRFKVFIPNDHTLHISFSVLWRRNQCQWSPVSTGATLHVRYSRKGASPEVQECTSSFTSLTSSPHLSKVDTSLGLRRWIFETLEPLQWHVVKGQDCHYWWGWNTQPTLYVKYIYVWTCLCVFGYVYK